MIDRRHVESFLAVVDHGSMSRAAVALHVTQPSVSQTIHALERRVHARLFDRRGARLTLTAAGLAFVEPARRIASDFETAMRAVHEATDGGAFHLELAAPAILARHPVAHLVQAFATAHPDVTIKIEDQVSPSSVFDAVASRRVQVGLATKHGDPTLGYHLLGHHSLTAVLPPGSADPGTPMTIEEMMRHTWITGLPLGFPSRTQLEGAITAKGLTQTRRVQTAHRQLIPELVLSGVGAAILIDEEARELAAAGAVVRRLDSVVERPYYLVYARPLLSPAGRAFIHVAQTVMDRVGRSRPT